MNMYLKIKMWKIKFINLFKNKIKLIKYVNIEN